MAQQKFNGGVTGLSTTSTQFVDEIRQRRRLQNRAPVTHWGVYVGTQGLTAYTHLSDHK